MKFSRVIKKVIACVVLAIISLTCFACSKDTAFEFSKELPTEVLYGNELYFKDYLKREYGTDYKLYATYYDNENGVQVTDELQESLLFEFDQVTDYTFKIVRNDKEKEALTCEIACMPEKPIFYEQEIKTVKKGKKLNINSIVFEAFGSTPIKNRDMVECDPDYTIGVEKLDIRNVDVNGEDKLDIDLSGQSFYTLSEDASYEFTFKAKTRAGETTTTVTFSTSDASNHFTSLDGYIIENGAGVDDNDLYFQVDGMVEPENGAKIQVRYGATTIDKSNVYEATYDAYTRKYKVSGFKHEIAKGSKGRLFIKEATVGENGGRNFSTYIATATLIDDTNVVNLPIQSDGYFLLTKDIDISKVPIVWKDGDKNRFSGTLDGNGYSLIGLRGADVTDEKGNTTIKGTFLFNEMEDATIKNIVFKDAIASIGVITGRTIGANVIKDVIVTIAKTTNTRTSMLGYHVEQSEYTLIKDVIIEMPVCSPVDSYVGAISTHAGGNCYVDGLYLIGGNGLLFSTKGNHATYRPTHLNTNWDNATLGVDYFHSNSAEDVFLAYNDGNMPKMTIDQLTKIGKILPLNESNITKLYKATNQYVYLERDIDMANVDINGDGEKNAEDVWNSFADHSVFVGILNGNGHSISNLSLIQDGQYNGFIFDAGSGARVENLNLHVKALSSNNDGGLFARVLGDVSVKNVSISVDQLKSYSNGTVAAMVSANLSLENVLINVNGGATAGMIGVVVGGSSTGKVLAKDLTIANFATAITGLCGQTEFAKGLYGFDGEQAIAGEDFNYYDAIVEVNEANLKTAQLVQVCTQLKNKFKASSKYVEITKDNVVEKLMTGGEGYFIIKEDINLANIDINGDSTVDSTDVWNATGVLKGVLNGNGKTIDYKGDADTGYDGFIFDTTNGTVIKNIVIYAGDITNNHDSVLTARMLGDTRVENVAIIINKLSSYNGGALSSYVGGNITVKNVLVDIKSGNNNTNGGLLLGWGADVANTKTVLLENVFVSTPVTSRYVLRGKMAALADGTVGTDGLKAVENEDFFMASGIIEFKREDMPTDMIKAVYDDLKEAFVYTEIDSENIETLLTATNGYYLLTDDVDMTDYKGTWNPTVEFTGVFNGNGYKLYNFKPLTGTAHKALFYKTNGATIKNLVFEVVELGGNSQAAIVGQIKGGASSVTQIENVFIDYDKFGAYGSGGVAAWIEGKMRLKNIVVSADQGVKDNNMGLLLGNITVTNDVYNENVFIYNPNPEITTYAVNSNMLGADGLAWEEGVDYFVYSDLFDLERVKELPTKLLNEAYEAKIQATAHTVITNENVDTLLNATTGYYVLGEDINMVGKSWVSTADFSGVLNGKGYKIYNLDLSAQGATALFKNFSGKIKQLELEVEGIENGQSALFETVTGTAVVEDVIINVKDITSSNSGVIAKAINGDLTISDALIYVSKKEITGTAKLFAGSGTATVTLDKVYVIAGEVDILYGGTINGTKDSDFFTFVDVPALLDANASETIVLTADILEGLTDLEIAIGLTNANIDTLTTATTGYWYLTEDIDMTGKIWNPTANFTGTFDGNGMVVNGFDATSTSLFNEFGGTIRNLAMSATVVGQNSAIIAKTITGDATVDGVAISVSTLNGSILATSVSADVLVYDLFVNVVTDNTSSLIVSNVANGKKVKVQSLKVIDSKEQISIGALYGVDGELAVESQDYFVFANVESAVDARMNGTASYTGLTVKQMAQLEVAYAITQENVTDILSMAGGYVYLTENIDMSDFVAPDATLKWKATLHFKGTFNGYGHKISNFDSSLGDATQQANAFFWHFTGTIKNLQFHATKVGNNCGTLVYVNKEQVHVENVVMDIDNFKTYGGGGLFAVNQAITTVKNVLINADTIEGNTNMGIICGSAADTKAITLDKVWIVNPSLDTNAEFKNIYLGVNGNTFVGTANQDYFMVKAGSDIQKDTLPTDFLKSAYDVLYGTQG